MQQACENSCTLIRTHILRGARRNRSHGYETPGMSPPWPSGLKHWNQTLVPVARAWFEPRCGRPHFAPARRGVRVCGRNRTEAREREWAEGTVSSLPGTLNVRIKLCHSTGIARSSGGQTCAMTKNQGPRSSRSRVKYTFQDPRFPRSRVKTFPDPGFPRSRVKYTFQDPGIPRSNVQYTFQDPGFPRSHVRYIFQDPGFPRSHDKYNFQDPESPRSHNLGSPRSHKYTFQDPESQDPMTSRNALHDTLIQCSQRPMSSWLTT